MIECPEQVGKEKPENQTQCGGEFKIKVRCMRLNVK